MLWDLFFIMRNRITSLVLVGVFSLLFSLGHPVQAQKNTGIVSDASATIESQESSVNFRNTKEYRLKKLAIKRVLERYNSPLISETDSFMDACYVNNLDCYLVPSIAGIESTFGIHIAPNTYNPFGWGGGYMQFATWDEAIKTVASGLRENYIGRGATTVAQIGRIYAPPSSTWAGNVTKLMSTFQKEEDKMSGFLEVL